MCINVDDCQLINYGRHESLIRAKINVYTRFFYSMEQEKHEFQRAHVLALIKCSTNFYVMMDSYKTFPWSFYVDPISQVSLLFKTSKLAYIEHPN